MVCHARNYVSTDIIRRIMMHHFNYNVKFVMNFTDIDDKVSIGGEGGKVQQQGRQLEGTNTRGFGPWPLDNSQGSSVTAAGA